MQYSTNTLQTIMPDNEDARSKAGGVTAHYRVDAGVIVDEFDLRIDTADVEGIYGSKPSFECYKYVATTEGKNRVEAVNHLSIERTIFRPISPEIDFSEM